jgi:RNA polymerase sigma-70 factor (ECF subfamily)
MDYLFGRAIMLCGNASDADDLLQDTLVLGLRKYHAFRPGTNLRAWLSRLQFNLYISSYRRRRNRPDGVALEAAMEPAGEPQPLVSTENFRYMKPEDLACNTDFNEGLAQEVKHGLHELDTRYRDVLLLSAIGEKSYQDIANQLDVPVGTVMSRLSRAKAHMRKHLATVN